MSTFLPKEIQDGLDAARIEAAQRKSRFRVEAGDQNVRVLRLWEGGFSVAAEKAPKLRGLVDLFDGARHLYQALIVASEEEAGELRYEFKRNTAAADAAPLDFARDPDAPIALLGPAID